MVRYLDHQLYTGHLNNGLVKVCYSDVSILQMFVFQIPTVFSFACFACRDILFLGVHLRNNGGPLLGNLFCITDWFFFATYFICI